MINFAKISLLLLCLSFSVSKNVYTPVLVQSSSQTFVQTADGNYA